MLPKVENDLHQLAVVYVEASVLGSLLKTECDSVTSTRPPCHSMLMMLMSNVYSDIYI